MATGYLHQLIKLVTSYSNEPRKLVTSYNNEPRKLVTSNNEPRKLVMSYSNEPRKLMTSYSNEPRKLVMYYNIKFCNTHFKTQPLHGTQCQNVLAGTPWRLCTDWCTMTGVSVQVAYMFDFYKNWLALSHPSLHVSFAGQETVHVHYFHTRHFTNLHGKGHGTSMRITIACLLSWNCQSVLAGCNLHVGEHWIIDQHRCNLRVVEHWIIDQHRCVHDLLVVYDTQKWTLASISVSGVLGHPWSQLHINKIWPRQVLVWNTCSVVYT